MPSDRERDLTPPRRDLVGSDVGADPLRRPFAKQLDRLARPPTPRPPTRWMPRAATTSSRSLSTGTSKDGSGIRSSTRPTSPAPRCSPTASRRTSALRRVRRTRAGLVPPALDRRRLRGASDHLPPACRRSGAMRAATRTPSAMQHRRRFDRLGEKELRSGEREPMRPGHRVRRAARHAPRADCHPADTCRGARHTLGPRGRVPDQGHRDAHHRLVGDREHDRADGAPATTGPRPLARGAGTQPQGRAPSIENATATG